MAAGEVRVAHDYHSLSKPSELCLPGSLENNLIDGESKFGLPSQWHHCTAFLRLQFEADWRLVIGEVVLYRAAQAPRYIRR